MKSRARTTRARSALLLFSVTLVIAGAPSLARATQRDQHNHEIHKQQSPASHGSQAAHVHGIAELFVVLEGEDLDIELRSPAMNLLGFEHPARTTGQRASVASAKQKLAESGSLFEFGLARCRLTGQLVDFSSLEEGAEHEETADGDDDHQHHGARDHSDIEARYHYHCDNPAAFRSLTTSITTHFPGINSLQIQWIVAGRQGTVTVDNKQRQATFR